MIRKKITMENSKINAMAVDPKMVAAFPFLTKQVEVPSCCGRTGRRPDYDGIKAAMVNLSPDEKVTLRTLLNTEKVTVFLNCGGAIQEVEL